MTEASKYKIPTHFTRYSQDNTCDKIDHPSNWLIAEFHFQNLGTSYRNNMTTNHIIRVNPSQNTTTRLGKNPWTHTLKILPRFLDLVKIFIDPPKNSNQSPDPKNSPQVFGLRRFLKTAQKTWTPSPDSKNSHQVFGLRRFLETPQKISPLTSQLLLPSPHTLPNTTATYSRTLSDSIILHIRNTDPPSYRGWLLIKIVFSKILSFYIASRPSWDELLTTNHETRAEPQQIVAQRLLSCVQYPVPKLSRLQMI